LMPSEELVMTKKSKGSLMSALCRLMVPCTFGSRTS
jgi:hypothetical protein